MSSEKILKSLDLFAGCGGFTRAGERTRGKVETTQFVEIDPDAIAAAQRQWQPRGGRFCLARAGRAFLIDAETREIGGGRRRPGGWQAVLRTLAAMTVLVYLLASMATGLSWDVWSFVLFRALTGAPADGGSAAAHCPSAPPELIALIDQMQAEPVARPVALVAEHRVSAVNRSAAERGLQVVEVVGLGRCQQLAGFDGHLVRLVLELGLLGPDLGLGLGRQLLGAGTETGQGQAGHRSEHLGILQGHLRIERHPTVGHGAQTGEVGPHEGHRALAVLDRIFRLGKLRLCGTSPNQAQK